MLRRYGSPASRPLALLLGSLLWLVACDSSGPAPPVVGPEDLTGLWEAAGFTNDEGVPSEQTSFVLFERMPSLDSLRFTDYYYRTADDSPSGTGCWYTEVDELERTGPNEYTVQFRGGERPQRIVYTFVPHEDGSLTLHGELENIADEDFTGVLRRVPKPRAFEPRCPGD